MLLAANVLLLTLKPVSPGPRPMPSSLPLKVLFVTARPVTFSVEPMPAVLLRIRLPLIVAFVTQPADSPPPSEMPVVQLPMMLLEIVTGPGTAVVLPNKTPREAAALLPVISNPEIVTVETPLSTNPPVTTASAARVPLPVTPEFGPWIVRLDVVIETVSLYVPASTWIVAPALAASTADWIVV